MISACSAKRFAAGMAAAAVLAFAQPVFAQEITPSHLKAARAAIASIRTTEIFDAILPQAADALERELIQKNPDLESQITQAVNEQTLKLAGRRGDLEKEVATAYARVFSEEELQAVADFYNSAAGKKLLSDGPIAAREVAKAADIWQRGIARDLAENVAKQVDASHKAAPGPAVAPAAAN